jgi:hypothetical protein
MMAEGVEDVDDCPARGQEAQQHEGGKDNAQDGKGATGLFHEDNLNDSRSLASRTDRSHFTGRGRARAV